MRAFVFPGQGSQYSGMAEDFSDFSRARYFFDLAEDVLGFDLCDIMNGDEEKLKLTENAQPAIYLASYIAYDELIREGCVPTIVAGHSLGEYTALAAADVYDFETGLYLVRKRGEFISSALKPGLGSMIAVVGLDVERVSSVIADLQNVWLANYNTRNQIVLSGLKESVDEAKRRLQASARKVVELRVSGPFHTPLIDEARLKMEKELQSVKFRKPRWPIVMNSTGMETSDPFEIKENILKQISGPVLWYQSVERMIAMGVNEFVEVGPSKVLTGLLRRLRANSVHFSDVLTRVA